MKEAGVAERTRVFVIDPDEIDRYARAIVHIADKGHPAESPELTRAVNMYGTAFQFLVMRRGAEYGRALAMAAGDRALTMLDQRPDAAALIAGALAEIHERVCQDEEDAQRQPDRDS
jgi:hypothetical protein